MKTTFKAFLFEDESAYRHMVDSYDGKNLSLEEIHQLPDPSPSNFEGSYKVGGVYFNNKDGMGAVPDNQNVEYKGFVGMMTPADFLKLAANHNGQREQSASDLLQTIEEGYPIGAPFIDISLADIEEDGFAVVLGHEGRARMLAIQRLARDGKLGLSESTEIPVHFFLRDGLRSRHITDEMIQSIKEHGIIPEDERRSSPQSAVKLKVLKEIYINQKKIEL